jgi:hypothetical protein
VATLTRSRFGSMALSPSSFKCSWSKRGDVTSSTTAAINSPARPALSCRGSESTRVLSCRGSESTRVLSCRGSESTRVLSCRGSESTRVHQGVGWGVGQRGAFSLVGGGTNPLK